MKCQSERRNGTLLRCTITSTILASSSVSGTQLEEKQGMMGTATCGSEQILVAQSPFVVSILIVHY